MLQVIDYDKDCNKRIAVKYQKSIVVDTIVKITESNKFKGI